MTKEGTNTTEGLKIGRAVKELRHKKQITLQDLAAKTGVPKSVLGEIEKGDVVPPVAATMESGRDHRDRPGAIAARHGCRHRGVWHLLGRRVAGVRRRRDRAQPAGQPGERGGLTRGPTVAEFCWRLRVPAAVGGLDLERVGSLLYGRQTGA